MDIDLIKNEIDGLEMTRVEWLKTRLTKFGAIELVSKIGNFEHTFSINFPHAEKYYKSDPFVKVNFNDGKDELENYCNNNLKRKDNKYFKDGIEHINRAMNGIIAGLSNKINQDEIKYLKDFNKRIEGLLLQIKDENDNDVKRIFRNNITEHIKKANDENDNLLKKVFNRFFDTNGYGWEELLNPTFFDTTMEDYVNKSNEFLKDK